MGKNVKFENDSVQKAKQLYDHLSRGDRVARPRDLQVNEAREYLPELYKAFSDTTQEHDTLLSNFFRNSDEQRARYKQLSDARQKLTHFILKLEEKVINWCSPQEGNKFKEMRRKMGIPDRDLY